MNYNNLIPVLINAIKQQQQQISALQQEKAALGVRLAALEKKTEKDISRARLSHGKHTPALKQRPSNSHGKLYSNL